MRFKIYDYDNVATDIDVGDKPIHHITVTILSGDETGIVYFKDGTTQSFDASEHRSTDYFDGEYIVDEMYLEEWVKINPKVSKYGTKSEERAKTFRKMQYNDNYSRG